MKQEWSLDTLIVKLSHEIELKKSVSIIKLEIFNCKNSSELSETAVAFKGM